MNRWMALLSAMVIGCVSTAHAQEPPPAPRIQKMNKVKSTTDRRNHRFAPFRNQNDNEIFRSGRERDIRSWNRYSHSRAERYQQRSKAYPPNVYYGVYRNYGDRRGFDYEYDGYGGGFNGTDQAEIYLNQSYYDDGPYGPGFYDRNRWYSWYMASHRTGQLLDVNRLKIDEGMKHFRAGRYDRAVIAWLGAARADHGDAASRIHAGHALFAIGRYRDAVKLLGRGFELAPQLATSTYDIRADYGDLGDFDRHLVTLKNHVIKNPNDRSAVTLLGYAISYTEGPSAAFPALDRAKQLDPDNTFVDKLWETSRLTSTPEDLEVISDVKGRAQSREPQWKSQREASQPEVARQTIKRASWTDHR